MSASDQPSLAVIASRYQTRITNFVFPAASQDILLQPNPRRWYVRFEVGQGFGGQYVLPMPTDFDLTLGGLVNLPLEYKYRDCPSIVTGGFVGAGQMGTSIIIIEVEYLD